MDWDDATGRKPVPGLQQERDGHVLYATVLFGVHRIPLETGAQTLNLTITSYNTYLIYILLLTGGIVQSVAPAFRIETALHGDACSSEGKGSGNGAFVAPDACHDKR